MKLFAQGLALIAALAVGSAAFAEDPKTPAPNGDKKAQAPSEPGKGDKEASGEKKPSTPSPTPNPAPSTPSK